jgi:hypothetical protein
MHMKTKTDDLCHDTIHERNAARLRRATQSVLLFAHTTGSTRSIFYFTAPRRSAIMNGDLEECIRQTELTRGSTLKYKSSWHTIFSWTRNDQNNIGVTLQMATDGTYQATSTGVQRSSWLATA